MPWSPPTTSPLFPSDILETYRVISGCIARGLAALGIRAEMKTEGRELAPDGTHRLRAFPSLPGTNFSWADGKSADPRRCDPRASSCSTGRCSWLSIPAGPAP